MKGLDMRLGRTVCSLIGATMLLLLAGCGGSGGGGINDNPPDAVVFLSASVDDEGQFIEVEMVKDVTTDTATLTASLSSNLPNIQQSIGVVNLESYEITYTRRDGGSPTVATFSDNLGVALTTPAFTGDLGLPSTVSTEIVVFPTSEKTFSEFAQSFAINPTQEVTFSCQLTLRGRNNAGDAVSTTTSFQLQTAVFLPIDSLLPVIDQVNESGAVTVGNDYFASWLATNGVQSGVFTTPWGQDLFLDTSFFPTGFLSQNTGFLEPTIADGTTVTFPAGVLAVFNTFGSATASASSLGGSEGQVFITNPPEPEPDPPTPVSVDQFFPDRSSINTGEEVLLSWSTSGGADELAILPSEYSGETVDFTGKDPNFDSVTIMPERTVRPLLRATRSEDGVFGESFLDTEITVNVPVDPNQPPSIVFFQASRANIAVNGQVVLFWDVAGGVERVELFPINGQRVDVTDRNAFLTPPQTQAGTQLFSLVAYGSDGTIVKADVSVNIAVDDNEQVQISNVTQAPNATIANNDDGSFSFTVLDPERQDSSWKVRKIAGDQASFFPLEGQIPGGLGDASVAFDDGIENGNGFLVFEISAFDDDLFGFSRGATRAVQLVTFSTTGALSDTGPTIDEVEFIPGAVPPSLPGTEGIINFTFSDPDTLPLRWTVSIIAGDFGGFLSEGTGTVNTGSGDVEVRYEDDPDTPDDPVVFLVKVEEMSESRPQLDLVVLRVEKTTPGPTVSDGETQTTPEDGSSEQIGFPFDGLYNNGNGDVAQSFRIDNLVLYFNGNLSDPQFFEDEALSQPVDNLSLVYDLTHPSGDASQINDVAVQAKFATPFEDDKNVKNVLFKGHYPEAGAAGNPSNAPINGGIGRYYFTFTTDDFRIDDNSPYNLPTTGSAVYEIVMQAAGENNRVGGLIKTLRIVVP